MTKPTVQTAEAQRLSEGVGHHSFTPTTGRGLRDKISQILVQHHHRTDQVLIDALVEFVRIKESTKYEYKFAPISEAAMGTDRAMDAACSDGWELVCVSHYSGMFWFRRIA